MKNEAQAPFGLGVQSQQRQDMMEQALPVFAEYGLLGLVLLGTAFGAMKIIQYFIRQIERMQTEHREERDEWHQRSIDAEEKREKRSDERHLSLLEAIRDVAGGK